VAKLFQNQEDLLKEFGQFLPDANGQGGFFSKVCYISFVDKDSKSLWS